MSEQNTQEPTKQPTALERLETLEKNAQQVMALAYKSENTARSVQSLTMAVQDALRTLEAISRVLIKRNLMSEDDITQEFVAADVERKESTEASLIQQKLVEEATETTAESLLVYKLVDQDGKTLSERAHVDLSTIHESVRGSFVGKSIGQEIETDGKKLTVLRVLNPVKSGQISEESTTANNG
jgi:hypothetical protein